MGTQTPADGKDEGAAAIAAAAAAGRSRLVADANLIGALVRIDEIEVAARAIDDQRADLLEYAIDLTEAVAEAVRVRDGALPDGGPGEALELDGGELGH
jgi:hypothetical protein